MASFELFELIFLQGEAGVMPKPYADGIQNLLTRLTTFEGPFAQIVSSTLSGAVVGRAALGARPFRGWGFEVYGGYTALRLNGRFSGRDLAAIIGDGLPTEISNQLLVDTVTMDAHLHHIHVGLAWRFLAYDDHLVIRPSIEYMQALAVDMNVSTSNRIHRPTVERVADEELSPLLIGNVKLPLIGVHAGYRFR